jgi:hypothetical protein
VTKHCAPAAQRGCVLQVTDFLVSDVIKEHPVFALLYSH